jgi:hypothetical protein
MAESGRAGEYSIRINAARRRESDDANLVALDRGARD